MPKSFDELSQLLKIEERRDTYSEFEALKNWCRQNISEDLVFPGDPREQFRRYEALARHYLDDFLPLVRQHNGLADQTKFNELLEYAIQNGYTKFIKEHSPLPLSVLDGVDAYGSVLHKSANGGYLTQIEELLRQGADVRKKDFKGHSPLQDALYLPFFSRSLVNKKEAIFKKFLLEAPELLDERDHAGNTVLHLCAESGFKNLVNEILNKKPALAFIANKNGEYPTHIAIRNNHSGILMRLLQVKGSCALVDPRKRNALHYAAAFGTRETVELCCKAIPSSIYLLKKSAEPTEARFVDEEESLFIVTNKTLHHFDAFTRKLQKLVFFDGKSIDDCKRELNIKQKRRASKGDLGCIKRLTGYIATQHCNARDIDESTPFHLAVHFNNLDTAKYLITKKRYARKQDFQGLTLMHLAVINENVPMLRMLLDSICEKRDCNAPSRDSQLLKGDDHGRSLLYYAEQACNEDIKNLLLDYGVYEMEYRPYVF